MKIFKCLSLIVVIVIIFSLFINDKAFAAADQAAATYKVTVQKIELKTAAGVWVAIATPNQEIDIAAVAAGAAAGSFLNDAVIPIGDYVNCRMTISETMKVKGCDGTNYTNAGGSAVLVAAAATSADIGAAPTSFTGANTTLSAITEGEMTIQINFDGGDTDDYIQIYKTTDFASMSVKDDSTIGVWMDFDTQNTVHYVAKDGWGGSGSNLPAANAMYFTPPGAGTSLSITVDGATTTITEAEMTMAF